MARYKVIDASPRFLAVAHSPLAARPAVSR